MNGHALVSQDGKYRYWLTRHFVGPFNSPGDKVSNCLVWVMLNPSTADASIDDPTIKRVMGFTERFGFSSLVVLNAFAYRATDPLDLKASGYDVGPDNDCWIEHALNQGYTDFVCAWGKNCPDWRAQQLWDLLAGYPSHQHHLYCLGTNGDNSPKHPLYLRNDTPLEYWSYI